MGFSTLEEKNEEPNNLFLYIYGLGKENVFTNFPNKFGIYSAFRYITEKIYNIITIEREVIILKAFWNLII